MPDGTPQTDLLQAHWSPEKLGRVLRADDSVLAAAVEQEAPGSSNDLAALMPAPERHLLMQDASDEKLEAKWSSLIQYLSDTLPVRGRGGTF